MQSIPVDAQPRRDARSPAIPESFHDTRQGLLRNCRVPARHVPSHFDGQSYSVDLPSPCGDPASDRHVYEPPPDPRDTMPTEPICPQPVPPTQCPWIPATRQGFPPYKTVVVR